MFDDTLLPDVVFPVVLVVLPLFVVLPEPDVLPGFFVTPLVVLFGVLVFGVFAPGVSVPGSFVPGVVVPGVSVPGSFVPGLSVSGLLLSLIHI